MGSEGLHGPFNLFIEREGVIFGVAERWRDISEGHATGRKLGIKSAPQDVVNVVLPRASVEVERHLARIGEEGLSIEGLIDAH